MATTERVICVEKTGLTKEYEAATTRFSQAVTDLHRNMGTSSKEEYERLTRVSNEARVKAEHTRLMLEQHIAEHRC